MVVCNLFDVGIKLCGGENPIVDFLIRTDLPAGTQIIYSCRRSYQDSQGEDSLWVGQSEKLTVSDGGECCGRIDMIASDKKAAEHYRQLNTGYSPPGISTSVSDTVTLRFVVGGRQRLREFGRNNAELSGNLVAIRGGINIVEAIRELTIPMNSTFQPAIVSP